MAIVAAGQQAKPKKKPHIGVIDLAATYTLERAKTTPSSCDCFWLNGGSADAAVTIYHGLGVAANFTGEHASNITPGVSFSKVSYMAGPRYTYDTSRFTKKHGTQVFGEALFGGVHAFDSVFPGAASVASTANAFSTQLGGGIDVAIGKGFSVRLPELDYVHTNLPNNGSNSQNDFRLAFGLSYRIGKH
jgi:hypothetical protein